MVARIREPTTYEQVIAQARKVAIHPVVSVTENVELITEMKKLLDLLRQMDIEESARWQV